MLGASELLGHQTRAFMRARHGVATVELALSVLLLMAMAMGVIELGRLYHAYHLSNKAVRDAARFLARQDIDCTAPGPTGSVENPHYVKAAKYLALTGFIRPVYLPELPNSLGHVPDSPRTSDLLMAGWSEYDTITVTVTCEDKVNGAMLGGSYSGAYASETFVPVVQMTANVPFTMLFDPWREPITSFTVSHNQVGIGDQYPDP